MRTFNNMLEEKLKDPKFKAAFEAEKEVIELALRIHEQREAMGMSQKELAKKAHVTQQHISRIENGQNYTAKTLFQVAHALKLKLAFK